MSTSDLIANFPVSGRCSCRACKRSQYGQDLVNRALTYLPEELKQELQAYYDYVENEMEGLGFLIESYQKDLGTVN